MYPVNIYTYNFIGLFHDFKLVTENTLIHVVY